jgi:hypothetical protein
VPDAAVVAAAVGGDSVAVAADLAMLELRGYARRTADGGWTAAHDEISELVLAQSDVASLRAAERGLALALAERKGVSVAEMRRIVALLVHAEADGEVGRVVQAWVGNGDCPIGTLQEVDLLPPGVPEERAAPLRRAVRRALPRARRDHRGHWTAAAVVLAIGLVSWYLTRPAALVVLDLPILANDTHIPTRPAVLGVVDRLGFRRSPAGIRVRVTGTKPRPVSGRVVEPMVDGRAVFDSMVVEARDSSQYVLTFEAPGLTPVQTREERRNLASVRIRSGSLNGQVLQGALPVVRVRPEEPIEGRLILEYDSYWPSASVFLGAIANWYPRESDTVSVVSLVTPIRNGRTEAPVSRVAPRRPGRYFLIWAVGAEPRAAYLFANSNWSCGAPVWHDGDDVQDLTADEIRAMSVRGFRGGDFLSCVDSGRPVAPHRRPSVTGIAAVEVIVTPKP